MNWETVIGLEVHAELSTSSKIFCGCSTAFGGEPNTRVCPVCAGFPGTLPKLNRAVVEYAVLVGLALNCEITRQCKFDRKNYFYPDLPKAYQVSQLYAPICRNGRLDVRADGEEKSIGIREIHMEEDAGKLIHDARSGKTFMDFNRCGVPLIEIVTHPDLRTAAQVIAYLEKLRETLLYLGVCDCKMQEGSLRADVNLSVRQAGSPPGTRTEMKNLNSFRAIARAIDYETKRQTEILREGGSVLQETRRWDDEKGFSYGMRSKENAPDYRYFPEPDLLPVEIDDAWLNALEKRLPELAHQKRERYVKDCGVSEKEAVIITAHKNVSDLFETLSELSGSPVESAHLVTGEIMRLLNQNNILPEELSPDARGLAFLVRLVSEGKINRNAYKETVEAVFVRGADPEKYIAENNLMMLADDEEAAVAVAAAVAAVLAENPGAKADYRAGKEKAFGFLMGQVMKKLGGSGNPDTARKSLKAALGE
ncbi:MAG: Asp-tRNA(Asn)/Glu-tRNA(Gln) amidotransferase subunit GatB [Oscillospiraceae bacterium]|jgi:aspartyl-tRNA(Asn)/glutamyl-tRNA(Gln) amidotransferase subunit B|nr:Asp-tRNA(Asn)/Glu-tRNA(Gln) amidotransferase subunit GatB [Oscillospiraceae bacterium]